MSKEITDKSSIAFACSFYQALGFGQNVPLAFKFGCNQIDLHGLSEQDIPKLIERVIQKDEISNHNLPEKYPGFIGRKAEIVDILEAVNSSWHYVFIEGMSGIGKTVLAIEVGYCCLPPTHNSVLEHPFQAVVWASARNRPEQKLQFNDIINRVAGVLKHDYLIDNIDLSLEKKKDEIKKLLWEHRTLLIIDDFEAIEDPDLEAWLMKEHERSKVLFTSRTVNIDRPWVVPLRGLSEAEALRLIRSCAKRKNLRRIEKAKKIDLIPLVQITDGHPLALEMALGLIKTGLTLDEVVDRLREGSKTVADIFENGVSWAWEALSGSKDAQHLLMAMFFFVDATQDALATVAGLTTNQLEKAIKKLVEMSLLSVEGELKSHDRRYSIHPIVRAFLKAQIEKRRLWETQARQRWVEYYRIFLENRVSRETIEEPYWKYLGGGRLRTMRQEWRNLLIVLKWIDEHGKHRDLVDLMERLVHYMDRRVHYSDRIIYAGKAALSARELGEVELEALFLIDALGLTLRACLKIM